MGTCQEQLVMMKTWWEHQMQPREHNSHFCLLLCNKHFLLILDVCSTPFITKKQPNKSTTNGTFHEKLKWTSNHQCTNWSFYSLDEFFFHLASDEVHHNPFLFTVDHCTFFWDLFLAIFSLDMTSHIATLLTFLPSYVLYQPWYLINYPLLT